MSETAYLGRNARLCKDGTAIAFGKNISVKISVEVLKSYSMDSNDPAVTGTGKATNTWSLERLYTTDIYVDLLKAGTKFDLIFAPDGSPGDTTKILTLEDAFITSWEVSTGEGPDCLEKISGEFTSLTTPT